MNTHTDSYRDAQIAMANLKAAVRFVLANATDGLTNAQVGRTLGIYGGHVGHEGHISRTLLALLESEGVAEQDPGTKCWRLKNHADAAAAILDDMAAERKKVVEDLLIQTHGTPRLDDNSGAVQS